MIDRIMRLAFFPTLLSVLLVLSVGAAAADEADQFFRELSSPVSMEGSQSPLRGQLRPVNYTVLSAGLDAKLKNFPVRVGGRVSSGQLIGEFDCEIEQAENKIGKARLDVARENLQINKRLDQLKNISSRDLAMSAAELSISEAELQRSSAMLSQCEINAPFAGTVTEKFAQAHQYIKKGEQLVELVDTHNLEIEMVLPSVDLATYQPDRIFLFVIDETDQKVRARVDRVVDVIDPVSQTIRVIGVLVDPPVGLMPGMSGVVDF